MADIKENEMSTASDCAYVRALDSNGNSIRISKADLASVVGGLLPNSSIENKGLLIQGELLYKTYWNATDAILINITRLNSNGTFGIIDIIRRVYGKNKCEYVTAELVNGIVARYKYSFSSDTTIEIYVKESTSSVELKLLSGNVDGPLEAHVKGISGIYTCNITKTTDLSTDGYTKVTIL